MRNGTNTIVQGIWGLGAAAMLWAGCTVTVAQSTDPNTAPPAAPVVSVNCSANEYLRGGKHTWRRGRWVWTAPRCVARTATWRTGCRWTRGHWVKSGSRYVYRQGRLACPSVIRHVGPTDAPPAPPMVRVTCGANQYLHGGKHVWRGGKWLWIAPRCVAHTTGWRTGCRWTRGTWRRVNGHMRYFAGKRFCPKVVPLRVVHPTWLPPRKPPVTYRRVRCKRGTQYYPGRYLWNNLARRYTWRGGTCIPRRRGCRWVKGRWAHYNGRSYYVRPAWRCRGKVSYVRHGGGTWNPTPAYGSFIRRKACRRGYFRNVKNRCVRFKRRCAAGFILRQGRCFKQYRPKRCGRGWVLRAGRCVRAGGVSLRACRPGFRRVGTRCVKSAVARRCRPGFALRGRKCVKVRGALRACRAGFARRGRKCVKIRRPVKRCGAGFARRGRKCVKIRRPVKRCGAGFARRGRKCVKIRRPVKRCRAGFVRRGRKCVKVRRPMRVGRPKAVKRCRAGFALRGRKCVKVRRPMRAVRPRTRKHCRKGFVRRGNRCVRRNRRR